MTAGPHVTSANCPILPNAARPAAVRPPLSTRTKLLRVAAAISGLLLMTPSTGAAEPFRLFATGSPGADGQTDGSPFGDFQFLGFRFFVPSPVTTEAIGGHMGGLGGVDVFGALVALSGSADFPDSRDLSTADVRGAARIMLSADGSPSGSRIFSAPLEVSLNPGWHALVFGSGLFGATGSGMLTMGNFPSTGQCFFGSGGLTRPELGFQDGCFSVNQMFVFVDAQAEATPTPEPSTLLLLGSGLAAVVRRRWRHA